MSARRDDKQWRAPREEEQRGRRHKGPADWCTYRCYRPLVSAVVRSQTVAQSCVDLDRKFRASLRSFFHPRQFILPSPRTPDASATPRNRGHSVHVSTAKPIFPAKRRAVNDLPVVAELAFKIRLLGAVSLWSLISSGVTVLTSAFSDSDRTDSPDTPGTSANTPAFENSKVSNSCLLYVGKHLRPIDFVAPDRGCRSPRIAAPVTPLESPEILHASKPIESRPATSRLIKVPVQKRTISDASRSCGNVSATGDVPRAPTQHDQASPQLHLSSDVPRERLLTNSRLGWPLHRHGKPYHG